MNKLPKAEIVTSPIFALHLEGCGLDQWPLSTTAI